MSRGGKKRSVVALLVAVLLALPLPASAQAFAPAHTPVVTPAEVRACTGEVSAPQGPAEVIRGRDRHRTAARTGQLPYLCAQSPAPEAPCAHAHTSSRASYTRPDRSIDELSAASLQVFRC
ncbi:hypothetical protein ACFV9W_17985 [Streptomyces sp. NPDC059897]|uniref:hypothetical protein n=1 Tax=Streptomyces sp. NPDC059897 TaxID=3346994 RepID=UPI0036622689